MFYYINPNVAKAGGLQSQGVKGDVVVLYFESLTTQNLKSSGVPDLLGRLVASSCPVVARRAESEARRTKSDGSGRCFNKAWSPIPLNLNLCSSYKGKRAESIKSFNLVRPTGCSWKLWSALGPWRCSVEVFRKGQCYYWLVEDFNRWFH
mgnify:CR=1 FL=1